MKLRNFSMRLAALAVLGTSWQASAGIKGPYTADANTRYLFHFEDPAGANKTTSSGNALDSLGGAPDAFAIDGTAEKNAETDPYPTVTTVLGATGSLGFRKCADLGTTAVLGLMVDANGTNLLANRGTDTTTITHASMMDASGSFTIEALVNVPTITSGTRTIVSFDVDTGTRGLLFRITGGGLLEYNFNSGSPNPGAITIAIPTTGSDAFVANQWFHVAAVHDNSTGQHNTTFYWTKLDANRTQANAIGSSTQEILTPSVAGPLVIGNEVNGNSGECLRGKIDEVRISKGVRAATDFVFNNLAPDSESDGMEDLWELQNFGDLSHDGSADADTNGGIDGLTDLQEFIEGTDPNDSDTDDDTLGDGNETHGTSNLFESGTYTSPKDADSDDDGLTDFQENGSLNTAFGQAPTNPNDPDTDDDTFSDHAEITQYGTNPNSAGSSPLLITLIGNEARNGSFELLGPPPGSPNMAKATHWDTDPDGDVTCWTVWPVESTAENDSGTEQLGPVSHGAKHAALQNGNAVYNLTEHVAQQGDVLSFHFNHLAGGTTVRGGLVYDNGGTITRLTAAEVTSTALGNGRGFIYVVPALSPLIGRQVGVGFKSTSNWPQLDSVSLTVPAVDADHDGLADLWEDRFFGNNDGFPTPAEIALYDGDDQLPDNDTFDNLAEQTAGSDPTNAASTPDDADADGLADAWEILYFNSLNALPGDDPDGDKDTNLIELANDTNPNYKFSFYSSTGDTIPDSWKAFFGIPDQVGTDDLDEGTGDGLDNSGEFASNTIPTDKDTDNDLREDGAEVNGPPVSNPLVVDTDGDGLPDGAEVNTYHSDPNLADSDGDSFADKFEVDHGSLPNDAASMPAQPNGFTLLEDFQGAGMTVGQTFNGVNGWVATVNSWATVADEPEAGGGDKVGRLVKETGAAASPLRKSLAATGIQILQPNTGTLFFQLRCVGSALDHSFGLSDNEQAGAFGDFEAQYINTGGTIRVRDAAVAVNTSIPYLLSPPRWINVWLVANNATDTFRVYYQTPTTAQTELVNGVDAFDFRNGLAANALTSFLIVENAAVNNPVYIDNIHIDPTAANLAVPPGLTKPGLIGPDNDGDGLPDTWETTYFGGPGEDGGGDFDHDGTDNLTEYRLGLIPNSSTSRFAASRSTSGVLRWPSVTGVTFRIERSTTLGSWTTLQASFPGVAGTAGYTDPDPPANMAFYRISLNN